jgi:hypothetical protein
VGLVALFALLVIGRFFGALTSLHALLLFATPLLAWLSELPPLRRFGSQLRGAFQMVIVILPLLFVLAQAKEKFAAASRPTAKVEEKTVEPSVEDYMNFGK